MQINYRDKKETRNKKDIKEIVVIVKFKNRDDEVITFYAGDAFDIIWKAFKEEYVV